MNGRLTTHVLDVSKGKPAAGLRLQLFARDEEGAAVLLRDARTNEEGRLVEPLLDGSDFREGLYEILFWAGEYFAGGDAGGGGNGSERFLDLIPVRFRVCDAAVHYHVPLLVAPGGYSTYRGS
ncbi:hydroxyisourate hydrolase [Cohnella sp. CFH 77786]|uniref:hydroxyisourate hydrolase n=1 Tax=Cohnella sp. CFH 77786 TaxID=2662265 RepID=UPI001C609AE7|nr:hydroxyisourate hydrolase [Cohnella sp. CFH 77786]MBW5448528.1 hydroxyisourate hydrolase [Cohnella sp. CFH 77786]